MSSTAALDPGTGEFSLEATVRYEGPAPTVPSYLRLVYLAPDGEPLPLEKEGEYASINLPPIGAHAVVVLD